MLMEHALDAPAVRDMDVEQLQRQPELVQRALAEHAEGLKRTEQLTLRKLGPGLKATIWLLRVYVLFMVVVVIVNVFQTIHS